MTRRITIVLEFDDEWSDYKDVADELILEDSGIYEGLKDGVKVIIENRKNEKGTIRGIVKNILPLRK